MSCGLSSGSVGRTDFRALISLRRSLDASIVSASELHSWHLHVNPRFSSMDLIRLLKERFSNPSGTISFGFQHSDSAYTHSSM